MRAMTGHIDYRIVLGRFLSGLDVVDPYTVVETVPEPAEHHFHKADGRHGEVGGNLVGILQGPVPSFEPGNVFVLGGFTDRLFHWLAAHQGVDQGPAVGQVGADDGLPDTPEVDAQDACELALGEFLIRGIVDGFSQRQWPAELDKEVAAVDQDGENF